MSILLDTGVDLRRSFRLATLASGSPLLLHELESGLSRLSQGEALSTYMDGLPALYPKIMVGLVRVGEEAACMPEVLAGLARTFTESTDHRLEVLTALLEPLLMSVVAVAVGTLILGVAAPMYGMINSSL
jgi:type IV pilus assembly protein PilC